MSRAVGAAAGAAGAAGVAGAAGAAGAATFTLPRLQCLRSPVTYVYTPRLQSAPSSRILARLELDTSWENDGENLMTSAFLFNA